MSTAEDLQSAATIEALGLTKTFQAIVDSAHIGKRIKREAIEPLITMRLVMYEQGRARPTHRGYSVSTRLIVMASQRNPAKPGYWRS